MKITMNPKDRPTFIFAGASMLAAAAMLWVLFLPVLRSADQAIARSALSLKKAQELALSKDSIESKYARIRSTASGEARRPASIIFRATNRSPSPIFWRAL